MKITADATIPLHLDSRNLKCNNFMRAYPQGRRNDKKARGANAHQRAPLYRLSSGEDINLQLCVDLPIYESKRT